MPLPIAEAANDPVICRADDAAACRDTMKFAVAMAPLGIMLVFIPQMMHRTEPALGAQESDFPVEVAAGPACRLMPVRSLLE
jgi:hypothetical protein